MNVREEESASPARDTSASRPDGGVTGDDGSTDTLLAMAISQPSAALTTAFRVLADTPSPRERSIAHHAIAIVERDRGRIAESVRHGRAALRSGRGVGPDREAEVRATLGTTHLFGGETARALTQLNRALALTSAAARPRVLHLRGSTYWLLGRYADALDDLLTSVDLSRRSGDRLWEGRALGTSGDVLLALGDADASEAAYRGAEEVLTQIGQDIEVVNAIHNRALASLQRGDVVGALAGMERARERYRAYGVDPVEQLVDYADALVSARLTTEARTVIDAALERDDFGPVWRADLLISSTRVALLEEDWDRARERARQAESLFRAHRRTRWAARATLLTLEASYSLLRTDLSRTEVTPSPPDAFSELAVRARRVVLRLRHLQDPSLPEALLLLAQIARDAGHPRSSRAALEEASRSRRVGTPLARAAGWLAAALLADQRGDHRALLLACRRGLDAVDEHRRIIGDLELRALASGYGLELASLAAGTAVATGNARALLWWVERWRSTSLTVSPARPDDPELDRDIAALRDVTRRLSTGAELGLARDRARLEAAVRVRYRRLRAESVTAAGPDVGSLVESLGDTVLLDLVLVKDTLYAVTVADGRARTRRLGSFAEAGRLAEYGRFTLRRAAYGRPVDLPAVGARLQQALLGDVMWREWSRRSVLVVPSASLLTVPWGLLPVFRETAVAVAPSVTMWQRARRAREQATAGTPGAVTLVTGPRLSTRQAEVTDLSSLHADATVLRGEQATVEAALHALDGVRLGHIAAHGTFRGDAPTFTSLALADGPLMIHDLDRLRRPPESLVLSACDSGGLQAIGADEALGLVTSLLAMGTSGVVASVTPVNDAATMVVMRMLHTVVAAGGSLAEGLLAARRAAGDDPLVAASAAAFTAWGA
ncbi:MAG: CHAT domain-containing protein [Lapillicoccus sp.]